MVVSLDFTKLELLEEEKPNIPTKKSKEKLGAASRKKKGGNRNKKKSNPTPRSSRGDAHLDKSTKELSEGMVNENVHTTFRKNPKNIREVKKSGLKDLVEIGNFEPGDVKVPSDSSISPAEATKSDRFYKNGIIEDRPNDVSNCRHTLIPYPSPTCNGVSSGDRLVQSDKEAYVHGSIDGNNHTDLKHHRHSDRVKENPSVGCSSAPSYDIADSSIAPPLVPVAGIHNVLCNRDIDSRNCQPFGETDSNLVFSGLRTKEIEAQEEINSIRERKNVSVFDSKPMNFSGCLSYEWPSLASMPFPSVNSHLPATTDRLHLDVSHNWQNHFQSFVPTMQQMRNRPTENECSRILPRPLPMSLDWPPMVRNGCGLAPSLTCSYDSGFISRRQSSFHKGFTAQGLQPNATTVDDERLYSGDFTDLSDLTNSHELKDEQDNHWISEEEFEVHTVSGMDYSQYFGGGVMYWNPSDYPGTSFSRPPSLSSDDSSWAWREADMNRAVDDMVAFSSSYSTNGLTSPSAASFCSPFDPLAPGHQAVGYVIPGNEVTGKLLHSSSTMTDGMAEENVSGSMSNLPGDGEVKTGDSLPYPILRPIIIPDMSHERSRSEFKRNHDLKSPCVPPNRREQPQIKRPPSPVVLCVPRAPRPPPPSPVGDSRKHRGFPTVRSGSSSPRHWGVRSLFHDGISFEEACVRMDGGEVVWPSWRNKSLSAHTMIQPLPGALLQDRRIAISQLTRDQEHPDVSIPLQPSESMSCPTSKASLSLIHNLLHDEIDAFCKQVAAENLIRKPYVNWAVRRVARSLQVLWPRSRTNIYGSNATGLSLPTSDVDLVVCLPPVRNLEPIKEAGILEGRNGIKETCLQHAARYLANQEWVKNDSLKIVENTAIPIIMLVVEVPHDLITPAASTMSTLKEEATEVISEGDNPFHDNMVNLETPASPKCSSMNTDAARDMKSIRLDISFKSPSHTGLQTTELVKELTEQFPAATPLALVLKQFLADRSLDQSYSGGLSSYCLILLITRFLQHEHHHGRPINQNFGSLLMDFFYFFGNVFDPRQMRISVRGSGVYINRERGCSIDPIYIDDPLFPTNNVGRNCFRIHQCIKAFADAYTTLENELTCLQNNGESSARPAHNLLQKIIPGIGLL
ncbi:Polynucleotide adenylyltransferase [Bertholletia excelsa]